MAQVVLSRVPGRANKRSEGSQVRIPPIPCGKQFRHHVVLSTPGTHHMTVLKGEGNHMTPRSRTRRAEVWYTPHSGSLTEGKSNDVHATKVLALRIPKHWSRYDIT